MADRYLVIMLKEPRPGRVKTRLGADIGMIEAARWFRTQSLSLIHRVQGPRWKTILAVSPDQQGLYSRVWPSHLPRIPQGRGDLGHRMSRVFRALPPGPACIIGADIPGISRPLISEAFDALGSNDAVFGPAADGGYWLVGLRRMRAQSSRLFCDVRWSTPDALADTKRAFSGLRIAETTCLRDIDTATDLALLSPAGRA